MRAWLKERLGAGFTLPLALLLSACGKSQGPAASTSLPDPVLAANAATSRPVPRRTLPLVVVTNVTAVAEPAPATNSPPIVTCGPAQTLSCSSADGLAVNLTAHVQDPDGNPLSVTWSTDGRDRETHQVTANEAPTAADVSASYTFVPGEHVVKVTVSDGVLAASCETMVTIVKDTQPPVLTCPHDVTVRTDPGRCSAVVTFNTKASDNCSEVTIICQPPSGFAFPIGPTTVACTGTDAAGNAADCGFDVVVQFTNRCPRNEGFWRQNPGAWPIQSMALGNQVYNRTQLLSLLRAPVPADASIVLARQLIVATLNTAAGSDPRPICGELAHANDAFASFSSKLPYRVALSSGVGRSMQNMSNALSSYNNGMMTGECVP